MKFLSKIKGFDFSSLKSYIYLGIAVILIPLFWKLFKAFSSVGTDKDSYVDKIDDIKINKSGMTLTDAQLIVSVNRLMNSFNNFSWIPYIGNTLEEEIFDVFTNLNKYDVAAIYKEFGIKPYALNGSASDVDLWLGTYTDMDLLGWLYAELSSSDYEDLTEQSNFELLK